KVLTKTWIARASDCAQGRPRLYLFGHHLSCDASRRIRPCSTLEGCRYDDVPKFIERTDSTSLRLRTLKTSNWPWTLAFPIWNHFARLRSSWLTRSAYSVPGGTNGTASCAAVIFGITRAPGVHGPL